MRVKLLLAVFVVLAVASWAAFGGGFTPKGTQPPVAHAVIAPSNCEACHGDFDFAENVEPWPTWAGSMMANSARDPLFWAALDVAENDVPGIGDFCLRCHAPTGWLAGRSEPPGGSTDGCGLVGNVDEPDGDFAGVSCHLCHRMMVNPSPPPGEDSVYLENGQYWIDDGDCTNPGTGPCRRGPYDYTGGDTPPPHQWAFSSYHTTSDICGNCHNVTSPAKTLIAGGVDTGIPFPIERTFDEWQASDFAPGGANPQTCQGCHMPDPTADPVFACIFTENDRTGDMPVHQFAGGNTWVPAVLRGDYPALDRAAEFDATIAWAFDMLQNRSATVEISAPPGVVPGEDLAVAVRVTNLTGHKLPTGYPEGRRMWLNLQARDASDTVIWQSGAYNSATGDLGSDPQLKVYHAEPGIWNLNGTARCDTTDGGGDPIFHFVRNDCYAVDNRIPPAGFTGGTDPELRPVAYTYPETSPGSGVLVNYDDTSYLIPIPGGATPPITVAATLYYQTASKEYVEFLRDQAVVNDFPDDCIPRSTGPVNMSRGEVLYSMWERYDRVPPVAMDGATVLLDVPLFADGFESGDTSAWSSATP